MGLLSGLTGFFKKEKTQDSNYLALTLTADEVLACIWIFKEDQVEVLGFDQRPFHYLDNLTRQVALAIDKAASLAQSDVEKTTFGLSRWWFDNGVLSKETSKILKNLSDELDLNPQAYISLAAAINHLLKIKESVTPQAVLVGNFDQFCEVHLIENNKVVATKIAKSKVNAGDITQLISKLKADNRDLPSRIILYGKTQTLGSELAKQKWQELFVHEPKIDILDLEELAQATAYAQAQDISGQSPKTTVVSAEKEEKPSQKSDEFGFVEGEDILLSQKPSPKVEEEVEEEKVETPKPEDFAVELDQQTPASSQPEKPSFSETVFTIGWFSKILDFFKKKTSAKRLAIALIILLVIFIGGSFVAGQFLTSADIIIKVKTNSKEQDFKLDLTGQEVTASVSGSQKAVATGSKKLGQYAKGEVTVFNWTTSPTVLPKDTTIITKDGIKFILDSEIEVASRSASTPGQTNTNVTAGEFGTSGNIGSGNDFTFQKFDELLYSARSNNEFTGGDEKQVTVVSQDDLTKLQKSLTDSLTEKAKGQLLEKSTGLQLPNEAILVKTKNLEFDKKLDEEASLVDLNMEIEASGLVYQESELKDKLANSLSGEISQNLQARSEDIEILEISAKRKDTTLSLSGRFRAKLVPKLDEGQLRDKIAGKGVKEARSIIKEISDVSDVEVKFSPNLPVTDIIPRDKSKIKFEIVST